MQGMEPLLILTPERQFSIASSAEAPPQQSYEMFADQTAKAPLSAYHAAFGTAPAPQPLESQPRPAEQGTQRQVEQRVQELFDMPAHLIPSLDQMLDGFVLAVAGQRQHA